MKSKILRIFVSIFHVFFAFHAISNIKKKIIWCKKKKFRGGGGGFMNFLYIEKNKILRILFSIFHVFFAFHAISKIKKKGGVDFFLEKQFFLISRFMLFSTLTKYWKVPLYLLVKWEVVSPNSREGQLESISIISSIPLFWFCISKWGGGGVLFFSHFMLYPTFLEKKIWEYKPIISHLMFSLCFFFLYAGNIEKCPFT